MSELKVPVCPSFHHHVVAPQFLKIFAILYLSGSTLDNFLGAVHGKPRFMTNAPLGFSR